MRVQSLDRVKEAGILGVYWRRQSGVLNGVYHMLDTLTDILVAHFSNIGVSEPDDLGWTMRKTVCGGYHLTTKAENIYLLAEGEDYYFDGNLWGYPVMVRLRGLFADMRTTMSKEDAVNSFNPVLYPTFEESPVGLIIGQEGYDTLNGLCAAFYGVGIEYYMYYAYIVHTFSDEMYTTSEIPTPYTKLKKALAAQPEPISSDPLLQELVKQYKVKFQGISGVYKALGNHIPGYTEEPYTGLAKWKMGIPTRESLNTLLYYMDIWEKLMDEIRD